MSGRRISLGGEKLENAPKNTTGKKHSGLRRAGALAFFLCSFAPAAQAQYFSFTKPSYPLEFYDIDYSYLADPARRSGPLDLLHYVPLGIGPDAYVSFGGELREQGWAQMNEAHALKAPYQNTYDLQRLVADAYLHFDRHFALFLQIARFDAFNKEAPLSAADESRGRVQQGFLELKENLGSAQLTMRAGRQEIALGSARFVWVNDSSNIRTTHDGGRVHIEDANLGTVDLVYTRPVNSVIDAFDDFDQHLGTFGAVYLGQKLIPNKVLNIDEYYYFRHNIGAQYAGLTGNEERDTVGGRL